MRRFEWSRITTQWHKFRRYTGNKLRGCKLVATAITEGWSAPSDPEVAFGGRCAALSGAGGAAQGGLDAVTPGSLRAIERGVGATHCFFEISGGFPGGDSQAQRDLDAH